MFYRLLAALALVVSPLAIADTVWLDNGDRITGRIELLDRGRLVVFTEFAGEVTIDVNRIRTLESDQPLLVKRADQAESALSILPSTVPGQIRVVNGLPDAYEVTLGSIDQMMVPQPLIKDWLLEGNADVAVFIKEGQVDERDLALRGKTRVRHGDWRHSLAGNFERYYLDDVKNRDLWQTSYDLSWFFDEQWFLQSAWNYQRDRIGWVSRRTQLGIGPGYEWWNTTLSRFETAARIDRVEMVERDGTEREFEALGLEWDFRRYMLGKRFELFHRAETLIPSDPSVRYIIDTELGLRYMLNSWASLNLLTEWDYTDSTTDADIDDIRYRFGLGISW
ncbi:Protein of unknown function, DUF481 [Halopseudomonas xinjiangensis]|uniref:Salt-induced outer membrane protein YdiY n=1 Tax=Halopseudomonas xinjiangensis TaxID=487184 RepID=A0A1H1URS4_9GAMM|nr:DUF481 domain-containing protein [Halopseudomonas xinjiangensis]SDS75222.1 Protein of unknown function, DUF481 [Halopseudomonas xinjiangensis]